MLVTVVLPSNSPVAVFLRDLDRAADRVRRQPEADRRDALEVDAGVVQDLAGADEADVQAAAERVARGLGADGGVGVVVLGLLAGRLQGGRRLAADQRDVPGRAGVGGVGRLDASRSRAGRPAGGVAVTVPVQPVAVPATRVAAAISSTRTVTSSQLAPSRPVDRDPERDLARRRHDDARPSATRA